MIKIEELYKYFGGNPVLRGIDLEINRGDVFAVLGPNGSGKTTLIKCILGMVFPDKGQIFFENKTIKNRHKYRNNIDYLPQIANFPSNLTVNELVGMIKNLRKSPICKEKELIERFGLQRQLDKKLNKLSGGTRQKVNLVLAFMFDSPLIILDEPTSGLDPSATIVLKELIKEEREKNKTILITSHIISFVEEIADEIVFILEGKIHFKGTISLLKEMTKQHNLEHAIASVLIKK